MKLMARKRLLVTILVMALITMFAVPLTALADSDTPKTYKVTYNMGGGDQSTSYEAEDEVIIAQYVGTKTGFIGWNLNGNDTDLLGAGYPDGHIYYPGDTITMPTNNLNFKAVFETEEEVPGISIKKSVLPTTVSELDVDVTYTFEIENTGNVDFNNVIIYDEAIGVVDLELGALAAGDDTTESVIFNLSNLGTDGYGDWDGSKFTNTATATGYFGEGDDDTIEDTDTAVVTYRDPSATTGAIRIIKEIPGIESSDVLFSFSVFPFEVESTIEVNAVAAIASGTASVDEPLMINNLPPGDYGVEETPAPGYIADDNDQTVTVTAGETATVTFVNRLDEEQPEGPGINLVKSVSPGTVTSRSADVTYTFTVTNNGDTQLYNVSLEDPSIGYLWDIGDLAKEATTSASVVFDLANVAGAWTSFTNVATVSAITESEDAIYDSDSATVTYSSGGGGGGGGGGGTTINEEPTPAGPVEETPIVEEPVPAAPLPQTGGIPSLLLYGLGALLAGGGATLKLRNRSK